MKNLSFSWRVRSLPAPSEKALQAFLGAAADHAGLPRTDWELEVLFVGDRAMARYNREIVGHSGTTDVITISYFEADDPVFPGETGVQLIVNPLAALREGEKRKNSGYATELARYLVHGLLHATGKSDLDPKSRAAMRRGELRVLRALAGNGWTPETLFFQ
ncbi:MAG: rRNA maturation RNase YbeY [Victivallaceae bacterium]|nr:rRNA maturation RNase YbeY [Victivallaceae bacterium]